VNNIRYKLLFPFIAALEKIRETRLYDAICVGKKHYDHLKISDKLVRHIAAQDHLFRPKPEKPLIINGVIVNVDYPQYLGQTRNDALSEITRRIIELEKQNED